MQTVYILTALYWK